MKLYSRRSTLAVTVTGANVPVAPVESASLSIQAPRVPGRLPACARSCRDVRRNTDRWPLTVEIREREARYDTSLAGARTDQSCYHRQRGYVFDSVRPFVCPWTRLREKIQAIFINPFNANCSIHCCCSKGSAPYWSNPAFLIFDIRTLWRSVLSARASECQKLKMLG